MYLLKSKIGNLKSGFSGLPKSLSANYMICGVIRLATLFIVPNTLRPPIINITRYDLKPSHNQYYQDW